MPATAANDNSLELADNANAASLGCGEFQAVKTLTAANTFDFVERQVYGNRSFATPNRDQDSDGQ
jgi:hypothetical protein